MQGLIYINSTYNPWPTDLLTHCWQLWPGWKQPHSITCPRILLPVKHDSVTQRPYSSFQLDLLQQLAVGCKQLESTMIATRDQHVTTSHWQSRGFFHGRPLMNVSATCVCPNDTTASVVCNIQTEHQRDSNAAETVSHFFWPFIGALKPQSNGPLQWAIRSSSSRMRWYNRRWWVGCYILYSEEGPRRAAAPPSPLLAVPNVTAHPSTVSVPTSCGTVLASVL